MKKYLRLVIFLFLILFPLKASGISETLLGQVGQPIYTLIVTGSGSGTGTITSNVYGVNCTSTIGVESGTCSVLIPMGTTVVLTATGISGVFNEWSGGGCSGGGTCTTIISGNMTIDANFILIPEQADLLAWYKVNEGSGTIIYNYAPASINRFGDLTISVGPNFWTTYPGFGYWNHSTTTVSGGFVAVSPFDVCPAGDSPITWIYFARSEIHLINGTFGHVFWIRPNFAATGMVAYSGVNNFRVDSGMSSTANVEVIFTPAADYFERRFFVAVTNPGLSGPDTTARIRFSDPPAAYVTGTWPETGACGEVSSVHLGRDPISPTAEETWHGTIGDILVWKKELTLDQINQVLSVLGSRWGF